MSDRSNRRVAVAAFALAAALACGCAPPDATPEPLAPAKVVVLGWDGATWDVIEPMMRRGELPHLAALVERGGRAVLMADPPMFSPVVWTTIATGFPPAEHGITDFEMPDPSGTGDVLAASFHRRRAPLWQMASSGGRSVGFIGWWATWPAEPVSGYVISDHLAYNRWDDWGRRASGDAFFTFPPELASELRPFAVSPQDLDAATLTALAPFDDDEVAEMMAAKAPIKYHAPSVLRFGYATDASNQSFALHMLERHPQPDLFALVWILSDVAGHVFWHDYEPQFYSDDRPDAGRLGEAIPNVYRRLDVWTGEILERIHPDSTVIVLSDHGMGAKRVLPSPGVRPSGDHTREGIFVIAGPSVPPGADLGLLSQLDIAPTLLALLDLPVAQDMPGHVIKTVVPGGVLEDERWIATYGSGDSVMPPDLEVPGTEEDYEARLRSLGYIQ